MLVGAILILAVTLTACVSRKNIKSNVSITLSNVIRGQAA
jgi:hypothetical protein